MRTQCERSKYWPVYPDIYIHTTGKERKKEKGRIPKDIKIEREMKIMRTMRMDKHEDEDGK